MRRLSPARRYIVATLLTILALSLALLTAGLTTTAVISPLGNGRTRSVFPLERNLLLGVSRPSSVTNRPKPVSELIAWQRHGGPMSNAASFSRFFFLQPTVSHVYISLFTSDIHMLLPRFRTRKKTVSP